MAERIVEFPEWRNLFKDARIDALQFSSVPPDLLAAVCWVRFDHPEVAWFDLRQDAVVDSTFGANRSKDLGTPPIPAVFPFIVSWFDNFLPRRFDLCEVHPS